MTVPHTDTARRDAVTRRARELCGTKYAYGKSGRTQGFDCSGLVQHVYAKVGIRVPRTAKEQYRTSRSLSRYRLQEGDLVFFSTNGRGASHVGIYIGNRQFIHAPSAGKRVCIASLDEPYWAGEFYAAGTFLD